MLKEFKKELEKKVRINKTSLFSYVYDFLKDEYDIISEELTKEIVEEALSEVNFSENAINEIRNGETKKIENKIEEHVNTVILQQIDGREDRLNAVRVLVNNIKDIGLTKAKDLVWNTPSTVYTGNDEKLAETIANQLTTSGCTVIHKKN